ncbi:MAG TPA: ABC transporter substrate-binding protein [Firmicutes bacterium]|jgi:iron complex transport system substrate-binding protein|nr:ABC transporter substrate-binding protein [Bacillota bacterium]
MISNRKAMRAGALLLSVILVLGVAGCATPPAQEAVEVVDQLGRTVKVPSKVERIASPYAIANSLVIALGAGDKIVGVETYAKDSKLYAKAAPHLLEAPGIGSGRELNIEECLKLNPDLVIVPSRMKEAAEKLEAQGVATIAIFPEDLDQMADTFALVGKAIGCEERANELVNFYREKTDMVKDLTASLAETDRPRVYLTSKDPLTTCTTEMYQHTMIELAGGQNCSAELDKGFWAQVSLEQVLTWNPDVIALVQGAKFTPEELMADPKWQSIPAIKSGRVYQFPSNLESWDYPTPGAVLGLLWLTSTLHPDLYERTNLEGDAQAFYQQFYNIDVTAEELGL